MKDAPESTKAKTNTAKSTKAAKAKPSKSSKPLAKRKSAGRLKSKFLDAYYGHPLKDMKLICITGTTGKSIVAHFVHQILNEAGQRVAVLASDAEIKTGVLHKFFSDAWKVGANYVVVTAPAESIARNAFYGLPVHCAALTDFVPAGLETPSAEEYLAAESTLFSMEPDLVILNRDDAHYDTFKAFAGRMATVTYGSDQFSDLRIDSSKLYKKGCEAHLNLNGMRFTVASFLPGEPVVHYMACAAAIATALHIAPDPIEAGIAAYAPEEAEEA